MLSENQRTLVQLCQRDMVNTIYAGECNVVLEFVFTTPSVNELSVPLVSRNTDIETDTAWHILSYLSGARAALLDMRFVYVDEDDEEFFLDDDTVKQLIDTKSIAHPSTGEELFDVDEYVSPVFFPTTKLRQLRGESV